MMKTHPVLCFLRKEYQAASSSPPADTEPKELAAALTLPHYLRVGYEFGRVDQILELEFTKLLEAGVRFRKCQRCGRYFILKGEFQSPVL